MIIRCPQCDHSRNVNESRIPPTAELATCPKCKHRFRFRTLDRAASEEAAGVSPPARETPAPDRRPGRAPVPDQPRPQVQRPQSAVREAAALRGEAREAAEELQRHWRAQMDRPVAEPPVVRLPRETPSGAAGAPGKGRAATEDAPSGEQGPRPEDRVEQDMRLLRAAPDSRPVRNLGNLQDFPDLELPPLDDREHSPPGEETADRAGAAQSDSGPAWENPAVHGWCRAFMSTLHGALLRSPAFFSRFSVGPPSGLGYLFFCIMGYVAILGDAFWRQALTALLPGTLPASPAGIALPVVLLLAPVALGLALVGACGCMRLFLLAFAPEKADFFLIYRVVCYATAPFLLSIVPVIGPIIGAAWSVILLVIGCRHALGLSWKLAVIAPLPPIAATVCGLIWLFP
jgi:predicted Zn finger-like uncharacterized protein